VEERRSQVCVGLDPDPAALAGPASVEGGGDVRRRAADAVGAWCEELIGAVAPAAVAVKLQLACFERLGAPGWEALERAAGAARAAGLLVIADGKRGDVPVSATAYAQALIGATPTPGGDVPGLGADAVTVSPLLGGDALEPFVAAAEAGGAGLFVLVRTSNPGAADLFDLDAGGAPLYERIAGLVAASAGRLRGGSGISGMGAVVGATEPDHLGRVRELLPESVFLLPGVGAQGGDPGSLAPAFAEHPASVLVTASRSIAGAPDPTAAAEELRAQVWSLREW
jgi:orotidine-5'-phosphate decarboxylase